MKLRLLFLVSTVFAAALIAAPAHLHGQQATADEDHSAHHPGTSAATAPVSPQQPGAPGAMMSPAKIDALVAKMNSAKGSAKIVAMAELLTALAIDRNECQPMMAEMMKKMDIMNGPGGMPMPPPAK